VPDPQDPGTFRRSRLDWSQPERDPYAPTLAWYRRLIALRKARPEITDPRLDQVRVDYDEDARWLLVHRGNLRIAAHLDGPAQGGTAVRLPVGLSGGGLNGAGEGVGGTVVWGTDGGRSSCVVPSGRGRE
jgi:maltooligosyltrehalose trehalohydrolase